MFPNPGFALWKPGYAKDFRTNAAVATLESLYKLKYSSELLPLCRRPLSMSQLNPLDD